MLRSVWAKKINFRHKSCLSSRQTGFFGLNWGSIFGFDCPSACNTDIFRFDVHSINTNCFKKVSIDCSSLNKSIGKIIYLSKIEIALFPSREMPSKPMKTLYLVRHAKSSWDYPVADQDRPLFTRGVNEAHLLSKHIEKLGVNPQKMISSPAIRALHTAVIFANNLHYPLNDINIDRELYDFYGNQLLEVVKKADDAIDRLMIFCHNNAVTSVANSIGNKPIVNVSTCGFVSIEFDILHWSEVKKGNTTLFLKPKQLLLP